ncbi:MAG TPA: DUF4856 domain-containing protein, partial [Arenibacter sp.]|nr:DUF4856 domain-containing protein [Arenibacter sp.]
GQNLKIPYSTLTPTSNYIQTFIGADGQSSVDFSGQRQRLDMFVELDGMMKLGQKEEVSAQKLKDMYANSNNAFSSPELNAATTKQLKNKTAVSLGITEAEKARTAIEGYFDKLALASMSFNVSASDGVAGVYTNAKGSKYLVDEKGIEWGQVVAKSLIGAVMFDQIVNGYLGDEKQGVDNNGLVEGKNYTQLEHHWDEAYGYLTSNGIYPKLKADGHAKDERALGSYAYQDVSAEEASKKTVELYAAFLKGRAAIVNKDDQTRKEQIGLIRTSLEKTLAKVTISYLKKTQDAIAANNFADAVHSLGEGAGFLYALRFAHQPKIDATASDDLFNELVGGPKGFYSLTAARLTEIRGQLATAYGVDPNATTTH